MYNDLSTAPTLLLMYHDGVLYVDFQALLKAFLPNLKSSMASCRRTAASGLVLICQHSRSPASFYNYLLTMLLGIKCLSVHCLSVYLSMVCLSSVLHSICQHFRSLASFYLRINDWFFGYYALIAQSNTKRA